MSRPRRAELGPLLLPMAVAWVLMSLVVGFAGVRAVNREEYVFAALLVLAAGAGLTYASRAYLMRRRIVAGALAEAEEEPPAEAAPRRCWVDTNYRGRRASANGGRHWDA